MLLDTNVVIWFLEGSRSLSRKVRQRMTAGEDEFYVSVVSGWEYEQKRRKGNPDFDRSFDELIDRLACVRLHMEFDVHRFAASLPMIHKDPFDRMLIAQAIHHDLTFIASDPDIHRYPVRWLW